MVNSGNLSWRAVGGYQKTTTFWYTDEPYLADGAGKSVLKFISVKSEATYNENQEYLFEDGKLIFYFYHFDYGEEDIQEYRFYFKDEKLIRYLQKGSEENPRYTRGDAHKVYDNAEQLSKSFMESF